MLSNTILLISANRNESPSPVYPLAIARLSAAVERSGHSVRQFDVQVHGLDTLPDILRDVQPGLIGISIRNIDSTNSASPDPCIEGYEEIVRAIRSGTSAPIVLGGSGFSLFPEILMQKLEADYGVVGPGEDALCSLLAALPDDKSSLSDIPGVIVGHGESASANICPDYGKPLQVQTCHDPHLLEYYWKNSGMIGLQTKRGCPRNCVYCTYPLIDGTRIHPAEAGQVVDELEKLSRDHGVRYVFFTDSVFNLCPANEIALAEEICRRGVSMSWGAYFCPSGLTRQYLATLRRSGLTHLEFGSDSLCDKVLDAYGKGFDVEEVITVSALCVELKLNYCHFVIFGGPGETMNTISQTLVNSRRMKHSLFFPAIGMRVYRNTRLHRIHNAEHPTPDEEYLNPIFYLADGLECDTITGIIEKEKLGVNYWVTLSDYRRLSRAMTRMRQKGRSGPLWEFLVK